MHYPVAIDNDFRTWRAYDQRYWPAHYLVDRTGRSARSTTARVRTPRPRPSSASFSLRPADASPSTRWRGAHAGTGHERQARGHREPRRHPRDVPRLPPGGRLREQRPRPRRVPHATRLRQRSSPTRSPSTAHGAGSPSGSPPRARMPASAPVHRAAKVFLVLGGTGTVRRQPWQAPHSGRCRSPARPPCTRSWTARQGGMPST